MSETKPRVDPLILLTDEPISNLDDDGLGLEAWARVVAGVAIGTPGPFTIGLFGSWGVGKTSILRLAKELVDSSALSHDGKVTTVEFNAWQYEQEEVPLIPLVATIVHELGKNQPKVRKAKDSLVRLQNALRSLFFGLSTKVAGKLPLVGEASLTLSPKDVVERYDDLRSKWIDKKMDSSVYHKSFESIVEAQNLDRNQNPHRVVVFIDDLDRCFPNRALQLLESIKLALNQPGFIFVLGLDKRILEDYLDKRYGEDFGLKDLHGQSYLDKIIQLPLWIPPHERRFAYLVEKLLDRSALEGQRDEFEALIDIIGLACEYNPRQLVRLFNDILISKQIYQFAHSQEGFPLGHFIISHGVRQQSDLIYQTLLRHQTLCDELAKSDDETLIGDSLLRFVSEMRPANVVDNLIKRVGGRDSLVRLLVSLEGKAWLRDRNLRLRIDGFLAVGWRSSDLDTEALSWVQEQLDRALEQIESSNEDTVMTACQTISMLGDEQCLPALKKIRSKWKPNTRIGKIVSHTYKRLLISFGETPSRHV